MQFGVARSVAKCLLDHGIDAAFFMTGGDQPLWIALKEAGINLYLARSEASAAYMADAYSRVSGKPSLVYGQWGPGAANVAAALADAWWARVPVVALTSFISTRAEYRNEYQGLEGQLRMFDPLTKWNGRVDRADRVAELLSKAIKHALSGCPGPVHLDVPRDVLEADDELREFPPGPEPSRPRPDIEAVRNVLRALIRAQRPVILSGNGVVLSGAEGELKRFAEAVNIPVITSMGGKGSFPEDHHLSVGVTGRYSRKVANDVFTDADFVLVIGSDLGGMVTRGWVYPTREQVTAQIDIDAGIIGTTPPVQHPIVADAQAFLEAANHLMGEFSGVGDWRNWSEETARRVTEWRQRFLKIAREAQDDGHIPPEAIIDVLAQHTTGQDTIVVDTGYMAAWAGALYPVRQTGRTFLRAAGSLGWAFPGAIGAQLANRQGRSFCITGDGGMGYHIGDIETAMRLGVPSITLVLNNSSLAFEDHIQRYMYNNVVPEVNDFMEMDYSAVARSFGAYGARVTTREELTDALNEALKDERPTVLDIPISKERYGPVVHYEQLMERQL